MQTLLSDPKLAFTLAVGFLALSSLMGGLLRAFGLLVLIKRLVPLALGASLFAAAAHFMA